MRFSRLILVAALVGGSMLAPAGAVMAHGVINNAFMPFADQNYTGSYPVTITHSQFSNGTYCLTLTQTSTHGGAAKLVAKQSYPYGSFLVIKGVMLTTIIEPLYGQNGAILFVDSARNGHIADGIFENIEGGSDFDAGQLAFGAKGGC